ncbi:hypothetical protein N7489_006878 [Penicillium chrysogenum]|uniref:Vacuolar ATPase assembly integral membrane protein n=1 Tax=Penicillium chrysogenum TaxID=5076 RepID=A0ABQ8W5F0_PENCH|nr:uncharacterized protein N7489_006878 [Penicillium chrysogenum]KAJ5236787.1 hypothetical protein N7489_006878 [Penicillium chrysogenum]KAJ5255687.1 hypothetical protein N7505_010838 [Penicillium chrysogenum]
MVLLVTTDRILAAFEVIPAARREELDLPTTLEARGPIAHEQLIRLARCLQTDTEYKEHVSHSPTVLSSLLRGTKVYVPPPPKKPEPSAEYLASKARLLAATEQESYNRLLNPNYQPNPDHADPHTSPYTTDGHVEEDTLTISLVSSIFISVLVTGFSVYAALTKFPTSQILASEAVKVLLGLFAALSVAVAESFLYWTYLGKVDRARVKERRLREKKVVIGAVGEENRAVDEGVEVGADKEEIWGKGVNGGVRRRVREKWEKGRDGEDVGSL